MVLGLALANRMVAGGADVGAFGDGLVLAALAVAARREEGEDEVFGGRGHRDPRLRPKFPSLPSVSQVSW